MKKIVKILILITFIVIGKSSLGQDYSYYDKFYVTIGGVQIEVRLDCLEFTSGLTYPGNSEVIENAFSDEPAFRAYLKGTNTRYYGNLQIAYHIDVEEFVNGNLSNTITTYLIGEMYDGELYIDPFNIYIHYTNNISNSTWFFIDGVSPL